MSLCRQNNRGIGSGKGVQVVRGGLEIMSFSVATGGGGGGGGGVEVDSLNRPATVPPRALLDPGCP